MYIHTFTSTVSENHDNSFTSHIITNNLSSKHTHILNIAGLKKTEERWFLKLFIKTSSFIVFCRGRQKTG